MKKVITLGFFDGVHAGHIKIIRKAVKEAKKNGLKTLAITFDITPAIKGHHCGVLTPLDEKIRLMRSAGISEVKVMNLTKVLRKMTPEVFFNKVLQKKFNPGLIIVGDDFRFGRNRSGNVDTLSKLCANAGVEFENVTDLKNNGEKVSSSAIRRLLLGGKIEEANRLLGRNYSIGGIVVKGCGLGSRLGFPTANLEVEKDKLLPPGVYAGAVRISGRSYRAFANIGTRPTFTKTPGVIPEIYIHKYLGGLLGKKITFLFSEKIRDEHKFASVEELKKQIVKDIRYK